MRSRFVAHADSQNGVGLELTEVSKLRESPGQQQFSITFLGPADIFLPQRMYRMDHDQMGALDLFIVPVGRDPKGFLYQAVFNRLTGGNK